VRVDDAGIDLKSQEFVGPLVISKASLHGETATMEKLGTPLHELSAFEGAIGNKASAGWTWVLATTLRTRVSVEG
jgi:hypothetical protein